MTCVVGIEHDGDVLIAGDIAGTDGWLRQTLRSDDKVFRVGEFTMGFTSSYRMGQLLRYRLTLGQPDTWDVDRFMSTTFIDAVRECLKAGGWSSVKESREVGGVFLVGIAGRLYHVDSDFQVGRSLDGYDAVGCGDDLALGALHATRHVRDPRGRVLRALEAAAHHSAGVAGPFTAMNSSGPVELRASGGPVSVPQRLTNLINGTDPFVIRPNPGIHL